MDTYNLLTGRVRQISYVVFAILGAAMGSTQVVYSSLDLGQPKWLIAALAVYAYVGVTFGLTAGNNVPKESNPDDQIDHDDSYVEDEETSEPTEDAIVAQAEVARQAPQAVQLPESEEDPTHPSFGPRPEDDDEGPVG